MEVKRKVISMEERDVIQEARTTITLLQTAFSRECKASPDAFRFKENLDQMLKVLLKARQVDNRLLIELEKFYQTASLLIGLGGLALNEEAFQAWRAYDHWHYEVVKSQLQVYGPTVVL
ncbi:helicase BlpT [Streptococcus australis]|uniref:helicase BlpT n=1 Tax=Streptococcus australis TaxID=113107 RepID=UPI002FE5517E